MAVDLHESNDAYHPETKLFPPHNIQGTRGRELYGELQRVYEERKDAIYWMDKTRYSAFCGTDLNQKRGNAGLPKSILSEFAPTSASLHTAVDAYNYGYRITVYEDAVASFNPEGHKWALSHFQSSLGHR